MKSAVTVVLDHLVGCQRRVADPNAVLLTLEYCPHPEVTPAVLDRLRVHQARALVFVVGSRIPKASGLQKHKVEEGHLLGNHTFAHRFDRHHDPLTIYRDVQQRQRAIGKRTGEQPRLFRALLGRSSPAALLAPPLVPTGSEAVDCRFGRLATSLARGSGAVCDPFVCNC